MTERVNTHPDDLDRQMDENLRLIGEHLAVPPAPDAHQMARWKQAPVMTTNPTRGLRAGWLRKGVHSMINRRFLTWTGAGSAVAAVLTVGTILLWSGGRKPVEASMIFSSLQTGMANAFAIELDNIGSDGVVVSGRGVSSFSATDAEEDTNIQLDLRITGQEGAELAGLDVEIHAAIVDEDKWIYVQTHDVPEEAASEPIVAWIMQATANGLLLDLTGIEDALADEDAAEEEEVPSGVVAFQLGGPTQPGSRNMTFDLNFSSGSAPEADTPEGVIVDSSVEIGTEQHDELAEAGEVLHAVLTGDATPQQIQQLVSFIESAAGEVHVQQLGGGVHEMTVSDFDIDELSDADADEIFGVELIVRYHEEEGVDFATFNHVGDYDGSIRIELTNVAIDTDRLDRDYYVEEGVTQLMSVSSILQLLGMFNGGA
jgi:hypothetical protein